VGGGVGFVSVKLESRERSPFISIKRTFTIHFQFPSIPNIENHYQLSINFNLLCQVGILQVESLAFFLDGPGTLEETLRPIVAGVYSPSA
jgi:hypothetical protein